MFGMNFFPEMPRPFKTQYRCFSVSMMPGPERDNLEKGGKIILPPSALDQLTRLNIVYPMLFKLTNAAVSIVEVIYPVLQLSFAVC
jgi:ubiquitin fusion degradation protein 1